MSAYIYYTIPANTTYMNVPCIKFMNTSNLTSADYVLFRYSVIVQTAQPNNVPIPEGEIMDNFSKCCVGNLQVFPAAFFGSPSPQFSLTNEVNGKNNYQVDSINPRIFYFTGSIYRDVSAFLTMSCTDYPIPTLFFNFDRCSTTSSFNLIYSIQLELLNPGKLSIDSIFTNNFTVNI